MSFDRARRRKHLRSGVPNVFVSFFDDARNAVYGSKGIAAVQRWRIDHNDRIRCFGEGFSWFNASMVPE